MRANDTPGEFPARTVELLQSFATDEPSQGFLDGGQGPGRRAGRLPGHVGSRALAGRARIKSLRKFVEIIREGFPSADDA